MLSPTRWIVALAALANAGWFVFDGTYALFTGAYVSPSSGPWAGRLGPWADLVARVGVDPTSTEMKGAFVAYGIIWILLIPFYLVHVPLSRLAMLVMALGAAWYLPFGTILCAAQIFLILLPKKYAKA